MSLQRDHPRICGEHIQNNFHRLSGWGSSPHMRGTLVARLYQHSRIGIIPAYAGNTVLAMAYERGRTDHPRICGEHRCIAASSCFLWGSSPHMRGTLWPSDRGLSSNGIIPAYAGNTRFFMWSMNVCRDHPRICGEHATHSAVPSGHRGSSPHMRGTLVAFVVHVVEQGIIPAYAGNTADKMIHRATVGDHPRICGEHQRASASDSPRRGSSPHMRGTLRRFWRCALADGIIPAYAGNTNCRPVGRSR